MSNGQWPVGSVHALPLPLILMSHFRQHFSRYRFWFWFEFGFVSFRFVTVCCCYCCWITVAWEHLPIFLPLPGSRLQSYIRTFMQFTEQSFPVSFCQLNCPALLPGEHIRTQHISPGSHLQKY